MKYNVSFELDFKRNPYRGKFMVLEGIDGSGKTTQAHNLVKELEKKGLKVVYTKEPTDEVTGKMVRDFLIGKIKLPPVAFQYLFAVDRAVHQEEIKKYLEKGTTVVSDRYFWSALIYGMLDVGAIGNKNEGQRLLAAYGILSMYHRFIAPDYTFYLSVTAKTAMQRIAKKTEKIEKLREGYEWLAKKFAKEITVVDGEGSVEEVTKRIVSKLT